MKKEEKKLSGVTGWGEKKTAVKGIVLIAVTLGIFVFLFRRIDLAEVASAISGINKPYFALAVFMTFSFPVMSAARWHLTLKGLNQPVPFGKCLLTIVGIWPMSAVSPSRVGDLLRAYSLRKTADSFTVAGSVIAERLLDLVVLSCFALAGGIVFRHRLIILVSACVLSAILLAGFVFLRFDFPFPGRNKVRDKLRTAIEAFRTLGKTPSLMLPIILLTAANWFGSILQVKILFHALGADIPLGFTAAALPVAIFVGLIPVTITGMGTRDAAMVSLFGIFAPGHQVLAAGLLYSFLDYWLMSAAGLPFVKKVMS